MTSRFNGAELGNQIVLQVREFVARSLGTFGERLTQLSTRLDALEKREPVVLQGEKGEPGPAGKDGESVSIDDLRDTIDQTVADAIKALARPQDGKDGRDGKDGESVDPEAVREMVTDAIAVVLAEMPKPKDGAPGLNGENGSPGRDGRDALQIEILPAVDPERRYPRNTYAKHAGGLIRAFRDTDAITLAEIEKSGWEVVLEGIAGETEVLSEDRRTLTRTTTYTSGKPWVRTYDTAFIEYRGVFRQGDTYSRGDLVTWGGSMFHCEAETQDKPENSPNWTLCVKRGRDGDRGKDK